MELIQDDNGFCGQCWKDINFITDPYCITCGKEFELAIKEYSKCLECFNKAPIFDISRTIFKFDEYSKNLIHSFKYYDKTVLAEFFASMLYHRYKADIKDADVIVQIPMHKLKRLLRMYNPPQLLASSLSKISNIPFAFDVLHKTRWTKQQSSLSRTKRLTNIHGSIEVNNTIKIKGKNVILIDDVVTTGATVNYASKILKRAGVKKVIVLSIASV